MKLNPVTKAFLDKIGLDQVHAFNGLDRRIVIYPCRSGNLLNVVAIHPATTKQSTKDSSWHESGSLQDLSDTYKDFGLEIREMCKLAEDVKLWSLGTRRPLRKFSGRLVLLGDAAHPTLPRKLLCQLIIVIDIRLTISRLLCFRPRTGRSTGAGRRSSNWGSLFRRPHPRRSGRAGQAIDRVRYNRATTVMMMSRVNDERRGEMMDELRKYVPSAELPENMWLYAWNSFPAKEAQHLIELQKQTAQAYL